MVTVVLRVWRAVPGGSWAELRLQTTHVQSGDVAYFRTIDGMTKYVERLMQQLTTGATSQAPIELFSRHTGED